MADLTEQQANQQTLQGTFASLGPSDPLRAGGFEEFSKKVIAEQQSNIPGGTRFGGGRELNLDAALGNLMGRQAGGSSSGSPSPSSTFEQDARSGKFGTGALLPDGTFAPGSGVTTASGATNQFNSLTTKLQGMIGDGVNGPSFIEPDATDSLDLIETQRDKIKLDLEQAIAGVKTDFERQRGQQQQTNREITGGTKAFLGRAGGLTSASGRSQVSKSVRAGNEALDNLTRLEQDTLQQARSAASSQDIALLQKSIDLADSIRQEKNQIRQNIFQNAISAGEFALSQQEALRNQASDTLSSLEALSAEQLSTLDQNAIQQLEEQAGLPAGFIDAFNETRKSIGEATSEQDVFDRSMDLLDRAIKMPSGTSFSLPIGPGGALVDIKGLDVGQFKIFESTDNAGRTTFTTINPATNEIVATLDAGVIGKALQARGGAPPIPADIIGLVSNMINLVGEEVDGQVVTNGDALQAVLSDPAVLADPKIADQVIDYFSRINSVQGTPNIISTKIKDQPISYIVDSQGNVDVDSITPIVLPESKNAGGAGQALLRGLRDGFKAIF